MEVSEGGKTKEDVPMDTQPAVAPVTPAPATAPRSESEAAQRLRLANAGYAPIKHQYVPKMTTILVHFFSNIVQIREKSR